MTVKELRDMLFAFSADTEVTIVQDVTTIEGILEGRSRTIVGVMQTHDIELTKNEVTEFGRAVKERALLICGRADERSRV